MLHLQDLAMQKEHTRKLTLSERLPDFLLAPCVLDVTYGVQAEDDFYLIHLRVDGVITLLCQRCMHEFSYPYTNQTTIAVCSTETRAEALLEHYECVVSSDGLVALEDLIIDELHLYVPQNHPDIQQCDEDVTHILNGNNETY